MFANSFAPLCDIPSPLSAGHEGDVGFLESLDSATAGPHVGTDHAVVASP
jgi:hypothetical protein